MSFPDEVREEICANINDKDKKFACLYGMLLFSRTLAEDKICFQSKSRKSADTFGSLFNAVFHTKPDCKKTEARNGKTTYIYEITDRELIASVFTKYHIESGQRHMNSEIISIGSLGVFTAGVFLAGGSVNDPEKEYHLEFTAPEEKIANELMNLLGDIGVTAGLTVRRGQFIVYIKDSECIEDTLTFINAQQCTLELMNVKIYKDMRNKVNRVTNCEIANLDKSLNAAHKQLADIELIAQTKGLDSLSDELREMAELRMDNIESSLKDLGEMLNPPISRSGVNHRLSKLGKIADEIRQNGGKNE